MLTFAAALAATINMGTIVMLPGTYVGTKFDLTLAKTVTVRAQGAVNVLLGEKKNVFTLHSGATWKCNIATVITQDRLFANVNDWRSYVFEWGTPEGLIVYPDPLEKGRTYRLDHYRLTWQIAGKDALAPGQFFYDSGTGILYLRRTDSSDPNGHDYWIPSQTAGNSFVSGGTAATNITLRGVRVFFGKDNFDLTGVARYTLSNVLAFGAANEGVILNYGAAGGTIGTETTCEYAANANDGVGRSASGTTITVTATDTWAHDNGDEGVSDHGPGCTISYIGGLYENNASSGSTWVQGAVVTFTNPRTRDNAGYGLLASIGTIGGSITGWLSERDFFAAGATSNSTLNVSSSTIILSAAVGALALYAGAVGDTVNFLTHVGGVTTPRAGGGTFNVT